MILTFEIDTTDEKVEIHANTEGLESLRDIIDDLLSLELKEETQDHFHLMTPDWGGSELSGELIGEKNHLAKHVKIYKWKDM